MFWFYVIAMALATMSVGLTLRLKKV